MKIKRKTFLYVIGSLLLTVLLGLTIYLFFKQPVTPVTPVTDCTWVTGVWSQCINGKQIRDISCQNNTEACNNNKCTSEKPSESKECEYLPNCCDYTKDVDNCTVNTSSGCGNGLYPIKNCTDCKKRIFPSNVHIFSPGQTNIQEIIDTVFAELGGPEPKNNGQFSKENAALLFMPGNYTLHIPIGYYTHVAGLGKNISDVNIIGGPDVNNSSTNFRIGALNNFWRTCENMTVKKPFTISNPNKMIYAISQATSLRSVNVEGDLSLGAQVADGNMGFASGGFMANCKIDGELNMASQQQFICRNTEFNSFPISLWNQVNVGCVSNKKIQTCCINTPTKPVSTAKNTTIIDKTPLIAEKPYLSLSDPNDKDTLIIRVPKLITDKVGQQENTSEIIDTYTIITDEITADDINKILKNQKSVIFSPGRYNIDKPIILRGQLLFGLGLPVLRSTNQNNIIEGYGKICGIIFEAGIGENGTNTLVKLDDKASYLWDICCRVGGGIDNNDTYSIDKMLSIGGANSILDNIWCWVADHYSSGKYTGWDKAACNIGVHITGDRVIAYGLFSEHNHKQNVLWEGNEGQVYLYQSEFNYFPKNVDSFKDAVSYQVSQNVTSHLIRGGGAYSFFPLKPIYAKSGFIFPQSVDYENILTVFLNGKGGIKHIINDTGITVQNDGFGINGTPSTTQIAYMCNKEGRNSDCPSRII
jgi:hypothetical protein